MYSFVISNLSHIQPGKKKRKIKEKKYCRLRCRTLLMFFLGKNDRTRQCYVKFLAGSEVEAAWGSKLEEIRMYLLTTCSYGCDLIHIEYHDAQKR